MEITYSDFLSLRDRILSRIFNTWYVGRKFSFHMLWKKQLIWKDLRYDIKLKY
jgi:hypothetical protein